VSYSPSRARILLEEEGKTMLDRVATWVHGHLGDRFDRWNDAPPGSQQEMDMGEIDDDGKPIHVVRTGNDGTELWLGYRTAWRFHCRHEEARTLAWFILWQWWAKSTWFGLKRVIWYWALRRIMDAHRKKYGI
jgi:hypothetical protein